MKREKACFKSEADLCRTFIAEIGEEWIAYPESCGFDILLVRKADGYQIGIEAKLVLNAKVIDQITEGYWDSIRSGPDFRAVLVPFGATGSLTPICNLVGITVIRMMSLESRGWGWGSRFRPDLPKIDTSYWHANEMWWDWAPDVRCTLPEYVPDVAAGASGPSSLTQWKIRAIKIVVILERRGFVTRSDFKALKIDPRRWLTPGVNWLLHGETRGFYVRGPYLPDFRKQHPVNFEEIAADYEKWAPESVIPQHQREML